MNSNCTISKMTEESREKNHLCEFCHKLFKSSPYLIRHACINKETQIENICQVCDMPFLTHQQLEKHMNSVHKNLKK